MQFKLNSRCNVCRHAQREEIHVARVRDNLSYKAIWEKYFSDKKFENINKALWKHFKKHFDTSVSPSLPATTERRGGPPPTAIERKVFDEAAAESINAIFNLAQLMRVLFDKVNWLEAEWQRMKQTTTCEHCGRSDDMAPNLSKLLACIKEIRELNSEWTRVQNPREIVKKHFADTFLRFTQRCTDIYTETLREKANVLRDSTNQFMRKEINEFLFARRVTELEDLGAERLGERVEVVFMEILGETLKKLDAA